MSKETLPGFASEYLREPGTTCASPAVRFFHRWLLENGLRVSELKSSHVAEFWLALAAQPICRSTRRGYRGVLRRYLEWLHRRGSISLDLRVLRANRKQPLAKPAQAFLSTLRATRKPATCSLYTTALRQFHAWVLDCNLSLDTLDNRLMKQWFTELCTRGQSPATRLNYILAVRVYLRVLHDNGLIPASGDELVRREDLPRLPRYLPRPIPPEPDKLLQRRLEASTCRYDIGLLLMRRTGLRIGELISLQYDCTRHVGHDRLCLKVPLGKLDSERLVPLDETTVGIITRLQHCGDPARRWLLETPRGRQTRPDHYYGPLANACKGLDIPDKMTSHRLRHAYATSLINAGMSLVGVMKLLGHRGYAMTLRYAEVTLETVAKEYFEALTELEKRYHRPLRSAPHNPEPLPDELISDVIRWLEKHPGAQPEHQRQTKLLSKRLRRIRLRLQDLRRRQTTHHSPPKDESREPEPTPLAPSPQ